MEPEFEILSSHVEMIHGQHVTVIDDARLVSASLVPTRPTDTSRLTLKAVGVDEGITL